MQTPTVPKGYVALASEWHGGQSSMLYAIASTGNLTIGTVRPYNVDADRPMTDPEWIHHLYWKLGRELDEVLKYNIDAVDRVNLTGFRGWVQETRDDLESTMIES